MSQLSNIQKMKADVEQLQREANVRRICVSEAIDDLKSYIQQHEPEDCLVHGFSSQRSNPFVNKHSCKIF